MSSGNSFVDWCRVPPEPSRNRHRKLFASSLIFTILGVSVFASLAPFYGGLMAGQTSALAMRNIILSVANLAEGPYYIQNVTYQAVTENCQQLAQDGNSDTPRFGCYSGYRGGELGNVNQSIVNTGEQDLTINAIEIYRGNQLFAVINGSFTVKAYSEGFINFQVYNLTELSKSEVEWLTQTDGTQYTNNDWIYDWRPILYTAVIKTSEGAIITYDHFTFPTAPGR
jgi:hypothetical protein